MPKGRLHPLEFVDRDQDPKPNPVTPVVADRIEFIRSHRRVELRTATMTVEKNLRASQRFQVIHRQARFQSLCSTG